MSYVCNLLGHDSIISKVPHLGNFYGGDPYCGARTDEIKEKNKVIQKLEQEVKRLTSRLDQLETRYGLKGGYTGARRGGPEPISAIKKRKW